MNAIKTSGSGSAMKYWIQKIVLIFFLNQCINVMQINASNETDSVTQETIHFEDSSSIDPPTGRQGRLISLGSGGETDILVKFTLPIITIPTETTGMMRNGLHLPMVKVNFRNIVIFTLLALFSAYLYPLVEGQLGRLTPHPTLSPHEEVIYHTPPPNWNEKDNNKGGRSFSFDINNWKDSLNRILFRDNSVTPCVQRIVCSAVVQSKRTNKPTNIDKIVDVMSSTMLFEQAVNGTVIKDAVSRGQEFEKPDECTSFFKDCAVEPEIITNTLKMVGL